MISQKIILDKKRVPFYAVFNVEGSNPFFEPHPDRNSAGQPGSLSIGLDSMDG